MNQSQEGKPIPIWGNQMPVKPAASIRREFLFFRAPYFWKKGHEIPNIVPFIVKNENVTPVMIIAPGGAYMGRAPHEGVPIAQWVNTLGISAFVLNYRHLPFRHPIPFLDAQRAIRFIRAHAADWNVDGNRIGMLGFSAGGHLTATAGTLAPRNWFPEDYHPDAIDAESDALQVMVLCYPVIHIQLLPKFLGKNPDPALVQNLNMDTQVTHNTPPTFMWTTRDDNGVPAWHTEQFAAALEAAGVDHETRIFEHGRHGLGLATDDPDVGRWTQYCASWLHDHGF
ncbi:MAG TPA: alpha/beta hydrolase [Candidatus Lokiarchaeia archaeon]|nr:alpha/beta hydrolase [Candidatus Lokiarchaeia archaeon]